MTAILLCFYAKFRIYKLEKSKIQKGRVTYGQMILLYIKTDSGNDL